MNNDENKKEKRALVFLSDDNDLNKETMGKLKFYLSDNYVGKVSISFNCQGGYILEEKIKLPYIKTDDGFRFFGLIGVDEFLKYLRLSGY